MQHSLEPTANCPPNITRKEREELTNLKRDRSIHVTKADGRNVTVVQNRLHYESKVAKHLQGRLYGRIEMNRVNNSLIS